MQNDPATADHPIRNEILSGRPLVTFCDAGLESAVVEAARVAGRLGDLRIVASPDDRDPPFSEGGATTCLPPPAIWATGRPREAWASWARVLPEMPAGEVGAASGILVVREADRQEGLGCFLAMERAAALRAAGEGRDPPLSVWRAWLHDARPCEPAHESRDFSLDGEACRVSGTAAVVAGAFRPAGWAEAVEAFDAGLKACEGPGLRAVVGEGRMAAAWARTVPVAGGEPQPLVRVYLVDIDGVPRCGEVRGYPLWEGGLATIAAEVFRGGLTRLRLPACMGVMSSTRRGFLKLGLRTALAPLFRPGPVEDPAIPMLRSLLDARADLRLAHAVQFTRDPESVMIRVASDPARAGARREFCLAWGGLSGTVLGRRMLSVVDGGGETIPAMAEALGVSIPVARRLVGRRAMPSLMALSGIAEPEIRVHEALTYPAAELFGALGHDLMPAPGDKAAWSGLHAVSAGITSILGRCRAQTSRIPVSEVAALMLGGGASWAARGDAVKAATGRPSVLADAGDMVEAFARLLTGLRGPTDSSLAFRVLAGHGSLARIHAASVRWHAAPELAGLPAGLGGPGWPLPFDRVDLGDGWEAVPLGDAGALRDEGMRGPDADGVAGLEHCVGGYAGHCREGRSLIVSVRRTSGGKTERVSTMDLRPREGGSVSIGGHAYHVAQHRSRGNAVPSAEAAAKASSLCEALSAGKIPVRPEAIGDPGTRVVDAPSRDEALTALPAWRRVLPERVAGLNAASLSELLARMEDGLPPVADAAVRRAMRRDGRPGRPPVGLAMR